MYESEFEWGSAVGGELVRNDEQGEKLRENIVKYFNGAVMENNLKWAFYEKNTAQTDDLYKSIKTNLKNQRGHAIFRDRYSEGGTEIPDRIYAAKDDLGKRDSNTHCPAMDVFAIFQLVGFDRHQPACILPH